MGTFFVEARLASPREPDRREPIKLLVDSSSTYTWVSARVLQGLGVQPTERQGRTLHTACLFGEDRNLEVLGAYTLEGFGLAVDPVQRRLLPAILYGA